MAMIAMTGLVMFGLVMFVLVRCSTVVLRLVRHSISVPGPVSCHAVRDVQIQCNTARRPIRAALLQTRNSSGRFTEH